MLSIKCFFSIPTIHSPLLKSLSFFFLIDAIWFEHFGSTGTSICCSVLTHATVCSQMAPPSEWRLALQVTFLKDSDPSPPGNIAEYSVKYYVSLQIIALWWVHIIWNITCNFIIETWDLASARISHDLSDSVSLLAVRAPLAFSIWRQPGNGTSRRYQELHQGELSSLWIKSLGVYCVYVVVQ